ASSSCSVVTSTATHAVAKTSVHASAATTNIAKILFIALSSSNGSALGDRQRYCRGGEPCGGCRERFAERFCRNFVRRLDVVERRVAERVVLRLQGREFCGRLGGLLALVESVVSRFEVEELFGVLPSDLFHRKDVGDDLVGSDGLGDRPRDRDDVGRAVLPHRVGGVIQFDGGDISAGFE